MKDAFKLGHSYDMTEYAKQFEWFNNCLARYYICNDVYDFHVYRIIIGFNSEYEEEPRTKLIEQGDINKYDVYNQMLEDLEMNKFVFSPKRDNFDIRSFPTNYIIGEEMEDTLFQYIIKTIVLLDFGDNDDLAEYRYDTPIEKLISDIDGGYGITVLDVDLKEE